MKFEEALGHLRAGETVSRKSWEPHVVGISIDPARRCFRHGRDEPHVALRLRYQARDEDGEYEPERIGALHWKPRVSDLTADDWFVSEESGCHMDRCYFCDKIARFVKIDKTTQRRLNLTNLQADTCCHKCLSQLEKEAEEK